LREYPSFSVDRRGCGSIQCSKYFACSYSVGFSGIWRVQFWNVFFGGNEKREIQYVQITLSFRSRRDCVYGWFLSFNLPRFWHAFHKRCELRGCEQSFIVADASNGYVVCWVSKSSFGYSGEWRSNCRMDYGMLCLHVGDGTYGFRGGF